MVEHLKAVHFARPARLAPQLVTKVLGGLRYKPGWSFEPAVLPDGTVTVRAIADLEDHLHPGRTFRTSRSAPLRVSGSRMTRRLKPGLLEQPHWASAHNWLFVTRRFRWRRWRAPDLRAR